MAALSSLLLSALVLQTVYGHVLHKPRFGSRIVGGEATTIDKYPHQVSIIYIDSHFCGGSILSSLYILTAAHCTDGLVARDLYVRAGSTMLNEGGQLKQVSNYFQHSKFDKDTYDYDISVLRLNQALSFDSTVKAIQLPAQDGSVDGDWLGTATGWGRLYENGPLPMELQKVDLPTIAWDICRMIYGDGITERMFCAGYVIGQKDTCQGDSGGPYVYNDVLLGITSWGEGCGAANSPGVYTKVSMFRNYIDNIINS